MRKNDDVRMSEAINFFRDTPAPPEISQAMKTGLLAALTDWNTQTPLVTRRRLSGMMSQERVTNRPATRALRQYRRSAILLKCAIINPDPAQWAAVIATYNAERFPPAATYADTVVTAVDTFFGSLAVGTRLIPQLKSDPSNFLATYRLTVDGPGASGSSPYYLSCSRGGLRLFAGNPTGRATTAALKVGVTPWLVALGNGLDRLEGARSADVPAADFIFTTQFSGCTFCFQKNVAGTEVVAAHINPSAHPSGDGRTLPATPSPSRGMSLKAPPEFGYAVAGDTIYQQLRDHGAFRNGNDGEFRAHGRNNLATLDSPGSYGPEAGYVIIMGIRIGGTWQIWRQVQAGGTLRALRIDQ